ncbi:LCP family protein [Cellulomonas iranensis]|uniref:LCP family protein n=1 Tax=Cellulomonas iranensis TaxID=76862 RepID=UPI001F08CB8A|nr:LCP family protein [Cellulomonas iranensis]
MAGRRPEVRPAGGGGTNPAVAPRTPAGRRRSRRRVVAAVAALVLVALVAWPVGLLVWANGLLQHTPALSGAASTPGTTYLLAGSDARGDDGGVQADGTEGQRTDTILVLHVPTSGPTALISLPRDTYVDVPGHGASKLNAAFAWGGAPLLVQTVEGLTGLTVDHYVEIGMGGVAHLVDAVGGVNLCYDRDVNDADSGMVWTSGCHDVDGTAALAFARMRKSDPTGDVGRALRQRQLIGAVMGKVDPRSLAFDPAAQVALVEAGTGAMTFDEDADVIDVARLALAFRDANGEGGVTGTPPIRSMDYRPGNVGSTVQLDPDLAPAFFTALRDGTLTPGPVGGVPTS